MKKTKRIAYTALLTALYFVLSALLRIPVTDHLVLDLGYIALTVGAFYLGGVSGAVIGAVGALLESMLMGQRGVSIGWITMNAIVGYCCGTVFAKIRNADKKEFWWKACLVIVLSMLLGVTAKTALDCVIYKLPLALKIPSGLVAWATDSLVMILFGLPLSLTLKKTVSKLI